MGKFSSCGAAMLAAMLEVLPQCLSLSICLVTFLVLCFKILHTFLHDTISTSHSAACLFVAKCRDRSLAYSQTFFFFKKKVILFGATPLGHRFTSDQVWGLVDTPVICDSAPGEYL